MCLNETCSKVRIGKHLSDSFLIQNGLKLGNALSPGGTEIKPVISASGLC
jgi:hypothetical protein